MNKGKFITIEGCEGVGKSTQTRFLKEYCSQNNIDAVFTREPGGTAISEKIRAVILDTGNTGMDALTELFLYEASRRQHMTEVILPALKNNKTVFCDRFIDSSFAYQCCGRGIDENIVNTLNSIAAQGAEIDGTLFLDLDPSMGFSRKGGADKADRLEGEGAEFFARVYKGFKYAAKLNAGRFIIIDAGGSKYETHEKIIAALKERGIF